MTGTNPVINSEWVRLNVGGKTFQTTKDTLSRYPESFLARLVNGELPSKKDKSGAYLVDGDSEHFRTILTYLRRGVLNLDGNQKTAKDLLCEADFYNIQPLVNEIRKAMGTVSKSTGMVKHVEIVVVKKLKYRKRVSSKLRDTAISLSEGQDDYEVLLALRQSIKMHSRHGIHYPPSGFDLNLALIEAVLHNYGFVEEFDDPRLEAGSWKFKRSV